MPPLVRLSLEGFSLSTGFYQNYIFCDCGLFQYLRFFVFDKTPFLLLLNAPFRDFSCQSYQLVLI